MISLFIMLLRYDGLKSFWRYGSERFMRCLTLKRVDCKGHAKTRRIFNLLQYGYQFYISLNSQP